MKKLLITIIISLAAQNVFAAQKSIPEYLRTTNEGTTDWSQAYGYSTNTPEFVETDPEALYYKRKKMEAQIDANTAAISQLDSRITDLSNKVQVLNYRVDALGWRMDLVDLSLSYLKREVRHLENHYHHYHFGCQFAWITSSTPLMKTLYYSNANSHFGQIYSPEGKVEILRHGTYSWIGNGSDSAVLVRVVANWAGQNVGRVGFVNASSLSCF